MASTRSSVEAMSSPENPGSSGPDEQRRSMTELKHLWEGMAAKNDRPPPTKNGDVQGKVKITWKKPQRIEAKPAPAAANPASKLPGIQVPKTDVDTGLMLTAQKDIAGKGFDAGRGILGDLTGGSDDAGTTTASMLGGRSGGAVPTPMVVRGSMLVQNSIDLVGWPPRVLDVVETTSDSDEGIVVEENTNLFHGRYFQARQNPVYFSDHEEEDTEQQDQTGRRSKGKAERRDAKEQNQGGKENVPSGISNAQNSVAYTPRKEQGRDAKDPPNVNHKVKLNGQNQNEILRIVDGSTSESVRQTITVERTDEELTPEMRDALLKDQSNVGKVVDVDVIQESVDVELSNGVAHVRVVVVCERMAQARRREGAEVVADGALRKTCVTVTRSTEIDMLATPDRRHVYERVMANFASSSGEDGAGSGALVPRGNRLGAEDIYRLYALFLEVIGDPVSASTSLDLTEGLGQLPSGGDEDGAVVRLDSMRRKGFPVTLLRLGQGFLDSTYSSLSSSSFSSSSAQ